MAAPWFLIKQNFQSLTLLRHLLFAGSAHLCLRAYDLSLHEATIFAWQIVIYRSSHPNVISDFFLYEYEILFNKKQNKIKRFYNHVLLRVWSFIITSLGQWFDLVYWFHRRQTITHDQSVSQLLLCGIRHDAACLFSSRCEIGRHTFGDKALYYRALCRFVCW